MTKLGRGLEALINNGPDSRDQITGVTTLRIRDIVPNRYQPRRQFDPEKLRELADSLRENGIIQPIIVTRREDDLYEIVAGERRLEAAKLANFREVPVIIRSVTPKEQLQFAIIENVQREDLNAIEIARAYQQLNDEFNLSHTQISEIVSKDRATISNFIRLLKLSEKIQLQILAGELTSGHARAILQVSENLQEEFAQIIVRNKFSVRRAEMEARKIKERGSVTPKRSRSGKRQEILEMEKELSRKYQIRVKISDKGDQGKILFHYNSQDELDKLLRKL
ncbi:MAG: ParB/RepB/Spo0J family partition protein [Candidatus Cloacimonetes bacterium]|nr:ParB/RepB/Spo0J family partition protein [Candidatus Cloacimonadota bacterium]